MINRIQRKIAYWQDILERRVICKNYAIEHQVAHYNWSRLLPYDFWLVNFIEKRNLLKNKPKARIALYSIFGPMWLSYFDKADTRIFVERENLHKPSMQQWLHRFLEDDRIDLSLGFDQIDHPQYMHFPFWIMWDIFSPTATYNEIKQQIKQINSPESHAYENKKFCAFLCSHNDVGRKKVFEQLSNIDKVDCDGRLFHNNDDLKQKYDDDKLKYLKHYRFNLTPENSNYNGYVTEKLFEAIHAGCIPIYNGSDNQPEPDVLNQNAIIFIEMGKENSNAISLVKTLNENEKAYLEFAQQPRFVPGAAEKIWNYYEELENKLKNIIT